MHLVCFIPVLCADDAMLSAVVDVINNENSSVTNSNRATGLAALVTAGASVSADGAGGIRSWSSATSDYEAELGTSKTYLAGVGGSRGARSNGQGTSGRWTSLHL